VEMSDVDEASVMHEMAHLPGEAVNEGCEYWTRTFLSR
jgi:hypothetical protein